MFMKTHVIPWMSKEETERLLQELKLEIGTGHIIKSATAKPVTEAPKPVESEKSSAALDIGSL